ncbi:MAG: alginate export family protein [Candidatus Sulfopaludibacter sp.]|nr:alginate export family protein [Candidatus Sulfopaludibacter sp.]
MYPYGRFLSLAAAAVALASAGDVQTPAAGASAGKSFVDWSPADRLPRWLQVGVQIRGRVEAPSGTSAFNSGSDGYYLSRIRVDLAIEPVSWLRLFAQAQDARVGGYNSAQAPATIYNPMDLRQGYVAVDHEGAVHVRVRAGRQELLFGGERVIGPADWGISRTFDAVDLLLDGGRAKVDLFAGSPVLIDNARFDRHKPGEHLYGAYGSVRRVLPSMDVEPYLLFKQTLLVKSETAIAGDGLVVSPGVRIFGKAPGRLDYTVEALLQRGSYSADTIVAGAMSYVAGWTIRNTALQPRISLEYNYASGDGAGKDGRRETFDQLYPSNHGYYGMIDQFGWENLKNRRMGFDCAPSKQLKLRADFNQFYLATVQDSLYNSSGSAVVLNRGATSNRIGAEINGVALYQWSRIWKFGAGYGHLFAGNYLKQSKLGFGYTYPYLMFLGNY